MNTLGYDDELLFKALLKPNDFFLVVYFDKSIFFL